MCRAAAGILVLALGAAVQSARAQASGTDAAVTRVRLARAESLWVDFTARDSAAHQRTYRERRATRFDSGPVTALLAGSVGAETGRRMAAGAAGYVGGVIPRKFVASHVVVALAASGVDSVLRASSLGSRIRVTADVATQPDTLADGWVVAAALARAYGETLDATWREWLPSDLGLGWALRRDGSAAVRDLMRGDTHGGAECLGGSVAGCRLWLGLDRDANPYATRYRPAELRRQIAGRYFATGDARNLAQECTAGSDDACLRLASLGFLPAIPAGPAPRGSILAYVKTRTRPAAVERALADTAGSVGDRLARAAGVSEGSLVGGWRIWLLTGGGQPRVTATLRDALPVVFFGGLLLLAAARSGRWR
jgi:hypothetical protein